MKSRKILRAVDTRTKEYYRIMYDDDHIPVELDKDLVDRRLGNLLESLNAVKNNIKKLYDYEDEIYRLVFEEHYNTLEVDDGISYRLEDLISIVEDIIEKLHNDSDNIDEPAKCVMLSDLGFKPVDYVKDMWEKVIEESDEYDVIEEVLLLSKTRRKRTTIWEKTDYGKSSKSITYEELPMTEEIEIAANNTQKNLHKK